tara:strand:+ start:2436 stop:3281 length:846 start_codon:yes stop_codon:yes gene_type:complete
MWRTQQLKRAMGRKSTQEAQATMLSVEGLSSTYGDRKILRDVSFSVKGGEIFVIMGRSGSGKTTLLKHLIGLNTSGEGSVKLLGHSLSTLKKNALYNLRKRIGVAFQGGALINSMNIIDNVELPLHQNTKLDSATIRIMSRMKLKMVSLIDAEHLMPTQLSGGMLKRAGLARAVVMDPDLLFFDEPSAGLDPVTSAAIDELILNLRDALKMTVVVVTHELDSALKIADRIMILGDGEIVALGTIDEIKQLMDPRVQSLLHRRPPDSSPDDEKYLDNLTRKQ